MKIIKALNKDFIFQEFKKGSHIYAFLHDETKVKKIEGGMDLETLSSMSKSNNIYFFKIEEVKYER